MKWKTFLKLQVLFRHVLKEGCTETVLKKLRFQTLAAARRTLALRGCRGKKQNKNLFYNKGNSNVNSWEQELSIVILFTTLWYFVPNRKWNGHWLQPGINSRWAFNTAAQKDFRQRRELLLPSLDKVGSL